MKLAVPPYVRISRVIRDIPSDDIAAGNKVTSLRQNIQAEIKRRGLKCKCIRCREIGHQDKYKVSGIKYQVSKNEYRAGNGTEYFLSIESPKHDTLFAFCRLRLPNIKSPTLNILPELQGAALIRELHTYGHLVPIDEKIAGASQHFGFGKKLMQEAEAIARKNGYKKMAVIAGIGVREYYKKLGYKQEKTYMVKKII
jgi:elongator complex protein 3